MNEPAVANEKPPYWDDCKGKTFDQLAEFIEEAREKLSDPASDADLPRSLEEFRALCEMLREKYEPEKPQREGGPSWSERLAGKHARRDRLVQLHHDLLRKALRPEQDKKKRRALNQEIRQAEERVEKVDREIDDLRYGDHSTEPVRVIRPRYATYSRICRAV